jgi:hypothetical protein
MGMRFFIAPLAAMATACSSSAQPKAGESGEPRAAEPQPAALSGEPIKRGFGGRDSLEGWLLACDNVRVCRAQPRNSGGSLMIRRDPGPDGLVRIVLDGQEPGDPMHPDIASIRLEGVAAPAAAWRFDPTDDRATLEGDAALAFVRTLTRATSLSYDTAEGRLEVPLTGLREALQAMDEAQAQAGSERAFVSVGPRPRAGLPAASALPVLEVDRGGSLPALPPGFAASVRQQSARHFAGCEPEVRSPDEAFPLNRTEAMVLAQCSYGPTHVDYLILQVPRDAPGRAQPVALPTLQVLDDGYEDEPGHYPNLEWDPATRQLHSASWSCAHACGENFTWVFDGRAFRLVSYSFYETGGAEGLDLYRAELRPRG